MLEARLLTAFLILAALLLSAIPDQAHGAPSTAEFSELFQRVQAPAHEARLPVTIQAAAIIGAFMITGLLAAFIHRNAVLTRINAKLVATMAQRGAAEQALAEQEETLRAILDALSAAVMVIDPSDRSVVLANPAAAQLVGLPESGIVGRHCLDFFRPGGDDLCPILDHGQPVDRAERTLKADDGREIPILKTVTRVRMRGREFLLESFMDISRQKETEGRLSRSLAEKDVLLREIHHRVKNNLQVVSSLLSLQSSESGDPGMAESIRKSRQRIRAMALVHENLYRSGDIAHIDSATYLRALAESISAAYSQPERNIHMLYDLADHPLDVDQAVPCGLLVNELVTNSFKHAFSAAIGRAGLVRFSTSVENGVFRIAVEDNGRGMSDKAASSASLGMQLVESLALQLRGGFRIEDRGEDEGGGTRVVVEFPVRGPAPASQQ
ncbi:signal transduction histidine kinase [Alkalidesulfovibrio alkalitolerans DSM 16529]|jgi:PAS domain S-box-containing protein|uniref:Signal transduction histidine kinase n=1 Tax=Alkalidesulfovibrio alkalitolerans DSM 16529 TaxID=1121439 RepID=S7TFX8_9BACT|nr:histidine kinase dimerization/phosphoacceptor domain -containing protein [Alkalidesulfovibrio alkalitolerans]EPR35515.1 signal transduction histidine kinase [Alkalidesulfovibrio alkalitolerans DSM 16529]